MCHDPLPPADLRANRKNIYIRDADLDVWERAERLAQEPISALVSRLLSNYVQQREATTHRIVVEIKDREDNVTRKAFKGRMLGRLRTVRSTGTSSPGPGDRGRRCSGRRTEARTGQDHGATGCEIDRRSTACCCEATQAARRRPAET